MCVEIFTSSFVSCKTQQCVIELGKIGPRGMDAATGLMESEALHRQPGLHRRPEGRTDCALLGKLIQEDE